MLSLKRNPDTKWKKKWKPKKEEEGWLQKQPYSIGSKLSYLNQIFIIYVGKFSFLKKLVGRFFLSIQKLGQMPILMKISDYIFNS